MLEKMGKTLLLGLAGVIVLAIGTLLSYIGITGLDQGRGWFLLGAVVLFGVSAFLLLKSGNADPFGVQKPKVIPPLIATGDKTILDRNNEMSQDWHKTNQTRERLKVLKMAEDVENGK